MSLAFLPIVLWTKLASRPSFPLHTGSLTPKPLQRMCVKEMGETSCGWFLKSSFKHNEVESDDTFLKQHLHHKEPPPLSQTGLHETPKYISKIHYTAIIWQMLHWPMIYFFYITDMYLLRLIMWRIGNNFKIIAVYIVFELIRYIMLCV